MKENRNWNDVMFRYVAKRGGRKMRLFYQEYAGHDVDNVLDRRFGCVVK